MLLGAAEDAVSDCAPTRATEAAATTTTSDEKSMVEVKNQLEKWSDHDGGGIYTERMLSILELTSIPHHEKFQSRPVSTLGS